MKKIRVTIPNYIVNIIEKDASDFGLNLNNFYNIIFYLYSKEEKNLNSIQKSKNNQIIQFNLNKRNEDLYMSTLRLYNVDVEAEFFKKIFYDYIDIPKYKREKLIFKDTVEELKKSIDKRKKVEIKFKEENRIIEPYFIKEAGGESRNYIHAFCEKNNEYRNFRLSKVKVIRVLSDSQQKHNEKYLTEIKNNFDPFLSYGKEVKVKLTSKGKEHYDLIVTNRPRIIKQEGDIYTFECTDEKARIYFPHFYDEAEVLEPKELREWFSEKNKSVYDLYK